MKSFYAPKNRGPRGVKRVALHMLMEEDTRQKLVRLTHKRKQSASDVVRELIAKAS